MSIQTDYKNFDILKIAVKRDKQEEMVKRYSSFLWQEVERKDDWQYENIIHLSFCRPHKIKNKDRLQLLQVHMETCVNALAKKESRRYAKSTAFGLIFMPIAVLIIALGLCLSIFMFSPLTLALGIALGIVGCTGIILSVLKIRKIIIRERADFELFKINAENQIAGYCVEAEKLCEEE